MKIRTHCDSSVWSLSIRSAPIRSAPIRPAKAFSAATLAVFLACGAAAGMSETGSTPGSVTVRAESVRLHRVTAEQARSIDAALVWQTRDAGLLAEPLVVTGQFRAIPGVKERDGRMVAKVRDRREMVRLASVESADGQAFAPRGGGGVADPVEAAERRMSGARARLAPSLIEAHDDIDLHAFRLPTGWTEEQMAALLMETGDYEFVEPDWRVFPLATTPNDPQFTNQWHHRPQNMNTALAWDYVTGGPDIIVAVCDTGVYKAHADLTTFAPGFNSVSNQAEADGGNINDTVNGHGTAVAGTMAARGNNGTGVVGVGWNFTIMPVRVSERADGTASLSDILQGARWAVSNGAFVANCSYGGANSSQASTAGNFIESNGGLLVFASGNEGVQDQTVHRPSVIIVGASTTSNTVAGFSNYGVGIDVVAPGVNIRTTNRTGGYENVTGTSFAAPLTAATLALVRAANPSLSNEEVKQVVFDSAMDTGAPGEDIFSGHGVINAGAAVQQAIFGPSSVALPYTDGFENGSLSILWRDVQGDVGVDAGAPGIDGFSLNIGGAGSITSIPLRASVIGFGIGEIAFSTANAAAPAGSTMLVEYRDLLGNWVPLKTVVSGGEQDASFVRHREAVPLLGRYDGLQVRFTTQNTGTEWYIDDVAVRVFEGNSIPWQTGFESGVSTDFDWSIAEAIAAVGQPGTPEGVSVARLAGAGVMVSKPVDSTVSADVLPIVRLRTRHEGVEAGKTLRVEFTDLFGNWQTAGTVTSDGSSPSEFSLHQFQLPFSAYSESLSVRLTAEGTQADDVWYIDDVAISYDLLDEEPGCVADIDGSGSLNFFDVTGFLALFNQQDPAADWDNNGTLNFFDVTGYLAAFNQGCP